MSVSCGIKIVPWGSATTQDIAGQALGLPQCSGFYSGASLRYFSQIFEIQVFKFMEYILGFNIDLICLIIPADCDW